MIYDVYIDLFFLINFSMDYICLYITAKVLRHKVKTAKFLLSSALGAIYAAVSLFLASPPALALVIDALVCLIMIAICFYGKRGSTKNIFLSTLLYVGISMLLGGIMTALFNLLNKLEIDLSFLSNDGVHTYLFAIIAIVSALLSIRGLSFITKKNRHREYFVDIDLLNKKCTLLGFVDTGNLVRDKISGKQIVFVDRKAVASIIPTDTEKRYYNGEILFSGSRLVPITTAQGQSMILVIVPNTVQLREKTHKAERVSRVDCLLGLTDVNMGEYTAIIPDDIRSLL